MSSGTNQVQREYERKKDEQKKENEAVRLRK